MIGLCRCRSSGWLVMVMMVLVWSCSVVRVVEGLAKPTILSITPSFGPDEGGTEIVIRGRNLAYLNQDVKIFMSTQQIKKQLPDMEVGWEVIRAVTPECIACGLTSTNVIVGKKRSNTLPFLFTNECHGPLVGDKRAIIPPRWSGEENCTICTELLLVSTATAPDTCSWQQFHEAMFAACESRHFTNFTVPGTKCFTDYNIACKVLATSQGDQLAGLVWKYWEMNYFSGKMIEMACAQVGRCDYDW